MPHTARRLAVASIAALAAIVAIIAADFTATAQAQRDDETAGRIVARRLDDGRVEFGWQPTGGSRILPRQRYFPPDAQVGRWLRSSLIEVDGAEIGRINARLSEDSRIEFGFTPTDGERILTRSRYFPADARVGRWLRSTEITISPAASSGFTAVSAGYNHTCAIRTSGTIECWGLNEYGQTDAPDGRYTAIGAGSNHTCAIRESGAITCWGLNGYYEPDETEERQLIETGQTDAPDGRYTVVGAGPDHTCAIRESGTITCWGLNGYYEPDETGERQLIETGQTSAPDGHFTTVSAGVAHTCGLRQDGAIECWGGGDYGQTDAPDGRFTAVSAGYAHTCAIRESGAIMCWGADSVGQSSNAPGGSFTAVSAGYAHTCAIRESGAIICWGWNPEGQTAALEGRFTAVSAGTWHTCAIRESDNAIECWGDGDYGQTDAPDGRFTAVSAGTWYTCAIRESDSAIECWGRNDVGQTDALEGRFIAVSAGPDHACAIRESKEIVCWGSNESYEYNDAGEVQLVETGQIDAPSGSFTAVSAGGEYSGGYTCAIRESDSAIECWGSNEYGQSEAPEGSFRAVSAGGWDTYAIRTGGESARWPVGDWYHYSPLSPFTAISAGAGHACAIRESDSAIECWGPNSVGLTNAPEGSFTIVSAASSYTCAIRGNTGAIECWGSRNNVLTNAPEGRFIAVSAGPDHACAIRESKEIVCWGLNRHRTTNLPTN